jgi:hypothetical protein
MTPRWIGRAAVALLLAGCAGGAGERSAASAPAPAPSEAPSDPADGPPVLTGTVEVAPELADRVSGGALFVAVWVIDPATGARASLPSAVARDPLPLPVAVAIGPQNRLVDSAPPLTGAVEVRAILDGDGEAMTREPGDLEGSLRLELPAKGVRLVLDRERPVERP